MGVVFGITCVSIGVLVGGIVTHHYETVAKGSVTGSMAAFDACAGGGTFTTSDDACESCQAKILTWPVQYHSKYDCYYQKIQTNAFKDCPYVANTYRPDDPNAKSSWNTQCEDTDDGDAKVCAGFCADVEEKNWTKKCWWANCNGCSECSSD